MATCCVLYNDLCAGSQRHLRGREGRGLQLTRNPSDGWICIGTDEVTCRWVDVTVLLQWSHLWYQLLLHYQLSSPYFCHYFPRLTFLRWEDRAAPRPWNVSPRRAWHLQIRAHYPGVTCPVPFKYHREGRMCVVVCVCVCVSACTGGVYEQSHKFNSLFWQSLYTEYMLKSNL